MRPRDGTLAVAVSLWLTLAAVVVGLPAATGPVVAASGSVAVQDAIYDDSTNFDVTVSSLDIQEAYLVVRNAATGKKLEEQISDGTYTIQTSNLGGIDEGDDIVAELYESNDEANLLDKDVTSVTGFQGTFDKSVYSVPQGQTVSLTATITNPGTVKHTESLQVAIDSGGPTLSSKSVSLAPGESTEVTWTWDTTDYDTTSYGAELQSLYDEEVLDVASITVEEADPPFFDVVIDSTNSPVLEGETLEVTTTVTNTGDKSDTQEINLTIDGTEQDATTLSLSGGESQTLTLTWSTGDGNAGTRLATVRSEDSGAEQDVTVNEPAPPNFAVQIDSTNSPVIEGDTLDVTATISNRGDESGSQPVELLIDEVTEDTRSVTLAGGESTTVTLSWGTTSGDAGTHAAAVTSANDTAETNVDVQSPAPANFDVAIDATNSPVTEGETLEVTTTVTNTGDETGTKDVALGIDGTQEDSTSLTLAGGESQTVTLSWETSDGDAGSHLATVESPDSGAETNVEVKEPSPANVAVAIDGTNSPVTAGQNLDVTATVSNTGSQSATQPVTLAIDGSQVASSSLTLAGGESRTVTLSWATGAGDAGDHDAVVASEDDTASATVSVAEPAGPPNFAVRITAPLESVHEGGTLEVPVKVSNTGDTGGTQEVSLAVGGTERDSTTLSLEGGASQSVTLAWTTRSGDAGTYTATVASANDSTRATVEVIEPLAPASLGVAIDFTSAPVLEGEELLVGGIVRNTGEASGTGTVALVVDGERVDSTRVSLDGGASTQVTLAWATAAGDAGNHSLQLITGNDSAATPVTVQAEPTATPTPTPVTTEPRADSARFDVAIDAVAAPVVGGTPLTVTATVTNSGDAAGSGDVGLLLAGERRDSRSLSLDPGEARTLNLTWATAAGDVGEYTAIVSTDGDTAEAPVAVRGPDASTFDVEIDAVKPPDGIGAPLTVTATVTNTGEAMDTQVISLGVDGADRSTKQLTLAGGAQATLEFDWAPDGEVGDTTLAVASEDDEDRSEVAGAEGGGGSLLADPLGLVPLLLLGALVGGGYYYVRRQQLHSGGGAAPPDEAAGASADEGATAGAGEDPGVESRK